MSKQRIHWNSRDLDRKHRKAIARKMEKIATLRALLEMWEPRQETEAHHQYVLQLRAKLRSAENQLAAMTI